MQIKKIILFSFVSIFAFTMNGLDFFSRSKPFTIMINPAGDAKDAGRVLNDYFERGVTLQFAQDLKKSLESIYSNIRVVLTRIPGETIEPLQNANFANRLDVDFYLGIHFYKEKDQLSKIYLYNYVSDPFYQQRSLGLYFYHFDDAYLINISKTVSFGSMMKNIFQNSDYQNQFNFMGFFSIPFKPLIGIKSPAIALEAGIKNMNDLQKILKPLVDSIGEIIKK